MVQMLLESIVFQDNQALVLGQRRNSIKIYWKQCRDYKNLLLSLNDSIDLTLSQF